MFDGFIFMCISLRIVFVSLRRLYYRVFDSKTPGSQVESTNCTLRSTKMIQSLMAKFSA